MPDAVGTVNVSDIMTSAMRVAAGVVLLDEHLPEWWGWWWKVDVETLDIQSFADCVLVQLFGGYSSALKILGLSTENAESVEHGFDAESSLAGQHGRDYIQSCAELTELWRAAIQIRRAAAANS